MVRARGPRRPLHLLAALLLAGAFVPWPAGRAPAPAALAAPLHAGPHIMPVPFPHGGRVGGQATLCPHGCPPPNAELITTGGPVQHAPKVYLIFWLPPGDHFTDAGTAAGDTAYETAMQTFFSNAGGSAMLNVVTQYGDSNGLMQNSVTLAGSWLDTGAYPEDPLQDPDEHAAIQQAWTANPSWDHGGQNDQYFVFTALNVAQCFPDAGGCAENNNNAVYCAYHDNFTPSNPANAPVVVYAAVPDEDICVNLFGAAPNGDAGTDMQVGIAWHEFVEAATDPLLNAWYDSASGFEMADECANYDGPLQADGSNENLNGHHFVVPEMFSNASHSCVAGFQRSNTFVVTDTGDSATCPNGSGQPGYTLRCALLAANTDAGAHDQILFALSGCTTRSPCQIQPATPLPTVTRSGLQLLASSQRGAYGSASLTSVANDTAALQIQLVPASGSSATTGLTISAGTVTVEGFSITGFSKDGILVAGAADTVAGNFIGVIPYGTNRYANGTGVEVSGTGDMIGGYQPTDRNVISGNIATGLLIDAGASGTTVLSNLIGPGAAVNVLGNTTGIVDRGTNDRLGVVDYENPVNWVSGNTGNGIVLDGSALSGGTKQNASVVDDELAPFLFGYSGNGGDGILVENGSLGNTLTDTAVKSSNGAGVEIADSTAPAGIAAVAVTAGGVTLGNQFTGNKAGGIIDDAVAGDPCTGTAGLPCALIGSTSPSQVSVKVVLPAGGSCTQCVLDLYQDPQEAHSEGSVLIAEKALGTFTTSATFTVTGLTIPLGQALTATVTRQVNAGDLRTSEFSTTIGDGCTLNAQNPIVTGCGLGVSDGSQATGGVGAITGIVPGSVRVAAHGGNAGDTIQVTRYSADPTAVSTGFQHGFFDIYSPAGPDFSSMDLIDCTNGPAGTLTWFDGTRWQPVSPAASAFGSCLSFSITSTSSPSLSQLNGTPFVASSNATRSLLASLRAVRHAGRTTITWRVADARGIAGFTLWSRATRLNRMLIPVHRGRRYRCIISRPLTGRVLLRAVLTTGRTQPLGTVTIPPPRP